MREEMISLQAERGRVRELPRDGAPVPLWLAAAYAFHQAYGESRSLVSRDEYRGALDITAAALARLVPIYVPGNRMDAGVAVAIDLARERFARGATELHRHDGTVLDRLSVSAADIDAAIPHVKRANLPFFAS